MKPKTWLIFFVMLASLLQGITDVVLYESSINIQSLVEIAWALVGLTLIFAWLYYDSLEVKYRRSALLNIGIVVAGLIFIPVYLYKSRNPRQRAKTIFWFFALLALWVFVTFVGQIGAQKITGIEFF